MKISISILLFSVLFLLKGHAQLSQPPDELYILVIDVQKKYYEGKRTEKDAVRMLENINSLIEKSDPAKVVYIQAGGSVLNLSFKKTTVDTVVFPPDDRLKRVNDHLITKFAGDAFTVKELTDFLRENNAKNILLTGLMAEKCVFNTAMGGLEQGFNIYILPAALMGKNPRSKEKAIGKMVENGARLMCN